MLVYQLMKIKTLIIDDEPIALEKLKNYVEKVSFLELVGVCSNGLEAVSLLADTAVDVIFTDIQMPDLNGIDMVGALAKAPMVVFITAYADYAVDSYKLSAVDYLLKPYGFADFQRAANKVLQQYTQSSMLHPQVSNEVSPSLFVKVDYRYVRVSLDQIIFIKGYGEYLQIYLEGEKLPVLTLSSFNAIKKSLSNDFLQVHRSYIVNMNHVEQISRGHIIMDDMTDVPIGDSFKDAVSEYLNSHSIGSSNRRSS